MARHYIMTDETGRILRGFSDDFEQPSVNDVCINEDGVRHFELNGVINPPMNDDNGALRYKLIDGVVVERTEEERSAEVVQAEPALTLDERFAAVEALVQGTPSYGELLEAVNILLGETP